MRRFLVEVEDEELIDVFLTVFLLLSDGGSIASGRIIMLSMFES